MCAVGMAVNSLVNEKGAHPEMNTLEFVTLRVCLAAGQAASLSETVNSLRGGSISSRCRREQNHGRRNNLLHDFLLCSISPTYRAYSNRFERHQEIDGTALGITDRFIAMAAGETSRRNVWTQAASLELSLRESVGLDRIKSASVAFPNIGP
jgi:hypothetical protein